MNKADIIVNIWREWTNSAEY